MALGGLVLPWAVALVLVLSHYHLNSAAVTLLFTVSFGWPVAWLTWASYRDAKGSGAAFAGDAGRPGEYHRPNAEGQLVTVLHAVPDRQDIVTPGAQPMPGVTSAPELLPPGPQWFTGRDAQLSMLDSALAGAQRADGYAVVVAICGMGGVGKTALALH